MAIQKPAGRMETLDMFGGRENFVEDNSQCKSTHVEFGHGARTDVKFDKITGAEIVGVKPGVVDANGKYVYSYWDKKNKTHHQVVKGISNTNTTVMQETYSSYYTSIGREQLQQHKDAQYDASLKQEKLAADNNTKIDDKVKRSNKGGKLAQQHLEKDLKDGIITQEEYDLQQDKSTTPNKVDNNHTKEKERQTTANKAKTDNANGNSQKTAYDLEVAARRRADGKPSTTGSKTDTPQSKSADNTSSPHDIQNKPVSKQQSSSPGQQQPPKKTKSSIKGGSKLAVAFGATVLVSYMMSKLSSSHKTNIVNPGQSTQFTDRQSAYIPSLYKRGFHDIKELTTDFGSSVHLDKAVNKFIRTPKNSSRNGYITSTNSVMNNNIALNMHNNAINHTRY